MGVCDNYIKNVNKAILLEENTNDIKDVVSFDNNDNFFNYRYCDSVVYYISDIHLDFKVYEKVNEGSTEKEIKTYIEDKAKELFSSIDKEEYENRIILFGGDLSSSIDLSKEFYSSFLRAWDDSSKKEYDEKRSAVLPLYERYMELEKKISEWESNKAWVKEAKKDLLDYSDKRVPQDIKVSITESGELSDQIYSIVGNKIKKYINEWRRPDKRIYAIIGNHELWEFDSVDKCVSVYRKMFEDLGIIFLYNDAKFAFIPQEPEKYSGETGKMERIKKEDNPAEYNYLNSRITNVIIVGGIGFAGYNKTFNANDLIYSTAVNREHEIELTKGWEQYYKSIVEKAKKQNCLLLVLTHNPPDDWKRDKAYDENSIYFYGHNHRGYLYHHRDSNVHIYADNQIGYKNDVIKFKKASIYKLYNPFASYGDGCYRIDPYEYLQFNVFSGVYIEGVELIRKYLSKYHRGLYLIKKSEYYGFFLVSEKREKNTPGGTYICVGGSVKKVSDTIELDYFENQMTNMVNAYIRLFKPYRAFQEDVSKAVKSFGGSGKIHGYIIDIDFYNHIMINPNDGKITCYYSYTYGDVTKYDSILDLLENHNPGLADKYKKLLNSYDSSTYTKIEKAEKKALTIKIDIKNSLYKESRQANQIQRLFDAHILRAWDDGILCEQEELKKENNNTIMLN